jgi:hypothetical protein
MIPPFIATSRNQLSIPSSIQADSPRKTEHHSLTSRRTQFSIFDNLGNPANPV